MVRSRLIRGTLAVAVLACGLRGIEPMQAQRTEVAIDPDDIGGVVTSSEGPEAGVWVIAETTDLPTRFARIVVTDNQGGMLCRISPGRRTRYSCAGIDYWIRRGRPQSRGSSSI